MIHCNYQYEPLLLFPMNSENENKYLTCENVDEDENELNVSNFTHTNLSNYPFRLSNIISFSQNENISPNSNLEE